MPGMADDKPLKSAYELAMDRFRKRDEDAGVVERPLSDEQKAAIADLRRVYQAKIAELDILHQGRLKQTADPGERAVLEEDYRRDRERLGAERDAKIEKARRADPA
jgi:hypothetical protein